ncbi:hypothetical protein C8Q79DRAFT_434851 [Trametes meyenii]|nr:hypothetical protein C8Q79DRAFT_434851 [Trametes meyenii]
MAMASPLELESDLASLTSPSESRSLPLEIWESIIDILCAHELPRFMPIANRTLRRNLSGTYTHFLYRQKDLYACTLTCRAWRVRVQYLLWKHVLLVHPHSVGAVYSTIISSDKPDRWVSLTTSVHMRGSFQYDPAILFMHSFPNLRSFTATSVRWLTYYPLFFRAICTPFFGGLMEMHLDRCNFVSLKNLFDVIWSCTIWQALSQLRRPDLLVRFIRESFPALAELHLCILEVSSADSPWNRLPNTAQPLLPLLGAVCLRPMSMVRKIALRAAYRDDPMHECCYMLSGRGEELGEWTFRDVFPRLERLKLSISKDTSHRDASGSCAAYIASRWASLRSIMVFKELEV